MWSTVIFPDWENGLAWDGSPVGTPLTENAIYLIDDVQIPGAGNDELVVDGGSEDDVTFYLL